MRLGDYHTHHRRCGHALGEIEDYIKVAIEKNLNEIGISDHFPLRAVFDDPQVAKLFKKASMEVEEFPKYIKEIKGLKEKYKDKIRVRISTEVGFYTPGNALSRQKEVLKPFIDDMDYIIGAVHNIKWHESPVIPIRPDEGILREYGEDKIILEYVNKLSRLVDTDFFDVIAHIDFYRIFFHPNNPQYSQDTWQKLLDLLDKIKNKGMAIEINTSGILKGLGSQHPHDEIVKEMIQRDIPLLLGSDAHKPDYVGYMFEDIIEKVRKLGLSHLCEYEKREQKLVRI
ncbi:MAG: histidinol-phosphatase [Candidatus Lokiarchaeota archaeon]|nr:histidinol-phosphatase [Candidatus Lokiarchaeota archaeon]